MLVSRKWNTKTLADHKAERRAFVLAVLVTYQADHAAEQAARHPGPADPPGFGKPSDVDPGRYTWQRASPSDPDVPPWQNPPS